MASQLVPGQPRLSPAQENGGPSPASLNLNLPPVVSFQHRFRIWFSSDRDKAKDSYFDLWGLAAMPLWDRIFWVVAIKRLRTNGTLGEAS